MPSASVPTYDQAPSSLKAMRTCALADDTNSNSRLAYCAHSTACCFTSACCWLLPPRKRMRIVEPLGHSFAIWNAARVRPMDMLSMRPRSEEHTSELQSLMRISYAVLCLKKKKQQ